MRNPSFQLKFLANNLIINIKCQYFLTEIQLNPLYLKIKFQIMFQAIGISYSLVFSIDHFATTLIFIRVLINFLKLYLIGICLKLKKI